MRTSSINDIPRFEVYSAQGPTLCDAFPSTKPQTIYFAEKPPALLQKNDPPLKKVSIESIEKEFKFKWSESVKIPEGVKDYYEIKQVIFEEKNHNATTLAQEKEQEQEQEQEQKEKKEIEAIINRKSIDHLALCRMKSVGSGVFATQFIPAEKDKPFILYTGLKGLTKPGNFYEYGLMNENVLSLSHNEMLIYPKTTPAEQKRLCNKMAYGLMDATLYGNIARFFQHLPEEHELPSYCLPEEILPYVATANLIHCKPSGKPTYRHQQCEVNTYKLITDIQQYGQVGFSYGPDFFAGRGKSFFLFNKKGELYIEVSFPEFKNKNNPGKPSIKLLMPAIADMASAKFKKKEHSQAMHYYQQALDNYIAEKKINTKAAAVCQRNIAVCLRELKKFSDAVIAQNKVVDIYKNIFGAEHADTAKAKSDLIALEALVKQQVAGTAMPVTPLVYTAAAAGSGVALMFSDQKEIPVVTSEVVSAVAVQKK